MELLGAVCEFPLSGLTAISDKRNMYLPPAAISVSMRWTLVSLSKKLQD